MIQHPELYAERLHAFLLQHPEAGEALQSLTGQDMTAKFREMSAAVRLGTFGAVEIRQLEKWHRQVRHLAADHARWN